MGTVPIQKFLYFAYSIVLQCHWQLACLLVWTGGRQMGRRVLDMKLEALHYQLQEQRSKNPLPAQMVIMSTLLLRLVVLLRIVPHISRCLAVAKFCKA